MKVCSFPRSLGRIRSFRAEDNGSATMLSLQFILITLVVGGLSIDFNKAISDRTKLQLAADSAAHAALYSRETMDPTDATQKGIDTIDGMLREDLYGGAVTTADVEFGSWDADLLEFVPDNTKKTAVRVSAELSGTRENASRNLLLGLVGRKTFNIDAASVYATYYPPCFTEGFVADDIVDIQSGNAFTDGFCIHSNTHVSMNGGNTFEAGTVVSMPDLNLIDLPQSGFATNTGLQSAMRTGEYRLRILNKLPSIIAGLWSADIDSFPRRLDGGGGDSTLIGGNANTYVNTMASARFVSPSDFIEGSVNTMLCGGSGNLTMQAGTYSNFAFVSNCKIKFANGVILEDVLVATENTSATSFNSPNGFQLGRDDDCAAGGGSVLMTLGGMDVAAGLQVYNGQILAIGDIEFAANADGIQGASFVSYGTISGTSNMSMGFCRNRGMENIYKAFYFRMME